MISIQIRISDLAVGLTVQTERWMPGLPSNSLRFRAGVQKKKPWRGLSESVSSSVRSRL